MNRASGRFSISEAGREIAKVQLSLSTGLREPASLQWAIVQGRCKSRMAPITSAELFPVLDVGPDGRAELDVETALALPAGELSLNVYLGGTSHDDILACGNLVQSR